MNNQIILSALESQLAIKKAERDSYETSTSEPAFKAMTQEVLESLRNNVSALIPSIMLDENRVEIMIGKRTLAQLPVRASRFCIV